MKKFLGVLLAFALIVPCAFFMSACKKDKDVTINIDGSSMTEVYVYLEGNPDINKGNTGHVAKNTECKFIVEIPYGYQLNTFEVKLNGNKVTLTKSSDGLSYYFTAVADKDLNITFAGELKAADVNVGVRVSSDDQSEMDLSQIYFRLKNGTGAFAGEIALSEIVNGALEGQVFAAAYESSVEFDIYTKDYSVRISNSIGNASGTYYHENGEWGAHFEKTVNSLSGIIIEINHYDFSTALDFGFMITGNDYRSEVISNSLYYMAVDNFGINETAKLTIVRKSESEDINKISGFISALNTIKVNGEVLNVSEENVTYGNLMHENNTDVLATGYIYTINLKKPYEYTNGSLYEYLIDLTALNLALLEN